MVDIREEITGQEDTEVFCDFNRTGKCGAHDVEIERRKIDRNRLADLKRDFELFKEKDWKDFRKTVMGHIGDLCTFKNRLLGVGVLGTIVVLGSYGYAEKVSSDSHAAISELEGQLRSTREQFEIKLQNTLAQVNSNRTDMAVIASQLSTTNERLKEVIELISQKEQRF